MYPNYSCNKQPYSAAQYNYCVTIHRNNGILLSAVNGITQYQFCSYSHWAARDSSTGRPEPPKLALLQCISSYWLHGREGSWCDATASIGATSIDALLMPAHWAACLLIEGGLSLVDLANCVQYVLAGSQWPLPFPLHSAVLVRCRPIYMYCLSHTAAMCRLHSFKPFKM